MKKKTHNRHVLVEIEKQYNMYKKNLEHLEKNMPGNVDPHHLNVVFGSYDNLFIGINPQDIKLTKSNTYKTHHPFVDRIVTSANSIWMTC